MQDLQYSPSNYEAIGQEYCYIPTSAHAVPQYYYPPADPYLPSDLPEASGGVAYTSLWTQPVEMPDPLVDEFSYAYGDVQFILSISPSQYPGSVHEPGAPQPSKASTSMRHNPPARFPCPVANCNAVFSRRFGLRGHLSRHAEVRPFICCWTGCGKAFARELDCKRHQRMRCSKAPYLVCHGCCKMFSRSDSLRRHWRNGSGVKCVEKGDALHAAEDAAEMLQSPVEDSEEGKLPCQAEVHSMHRSDR